MLSQIDFTGADGAKMIGPSGNANIFEFSKFLYPKRSSGRTKL
jgi:hypothetical protein